MPQNLGNIRSGSAILCVRVPSSIALSSKVNSRCSSAGGGGVDVCGRDGSGGVKSLLTYGFSNLVPARVCVKVTRSRRANLSVIDTDRQLIYYLDHIG